MTDTASLAALLSPDGQRLLAELSTETLGPADEVRVITRYREKYPAALVSAALVQVKLRVRARAKFSRADAMYFTQAGLEQASTERMARYHAKRFAPFARVADLCSGIGGDLIGLAERGETIAVDLDEEHLRLGALNAAAYGVGDRVTSVCEDVRDFPVERMDAAFIDPARRTRDKRMRGSESEPPLEWCFGMGERGIPLGIKAAPALDLEVVPEGWEIEMVSEGRELKETLLWSPLLTTTRRRATVLPAEASLIDTGARLDVRPPGGFLIDPDPAVTRAGLVAELGEELGTAWKIDEQVGFLSMDVPVASPFGRTLEVEASLPWSLARLKDVLRGLDVGVVDIRKRGSAVDVDEIQKRLKLTGSRAVAVVLTRVADKPWAFVCRLLT